MCESLRRRATLSIRLPTHERIGRGEAALNRRTRGISPAARPPAVQQPRNEDA